MNAFKVRYRLGSDRNSCHFQQVARVRLTILTFMVVALMGVRQSEAATFRVDDTRMTVPSILADDWRAIQHRKTWTRSDGKAVGGEANFVRFLAREYSFTANEEGFRLKTMWFASGKCVSTDELISSLTAAKRKSLESAFGSLIEMRARLEETPEVPQVRVVIWAHFKSTHEVSLPFETLASDDSKTLEPFAELARQAFDTRVSRKTKCKEGSDPASTRESARSGGRRMLPSKSQSKSGTSPTRSAPRPTGGLVVGELPQPGTSPERPDRRVDERGRKQEWPILISRFVASPGSLVFEPAGQFTRCILAYSEREALTAMRAAYRPQAASGSGRRTSYTVSATGSSGCGQSNAGGADDAASLENESTGSGEPVGEGPSAAGGEDSGDAFQPYADPLDIDSSYSDEGGSRSDAVGELDFESIPTSGDLEGDMIESELEATDVPSE
jgi:hypothetical protein